MKIPLIGIDNTALAIHFVGIGGIGMSAIAEVLIRSGYPVSGSDLKSSPIIQHLVDLGARIEIGHHASHLGDAQVLVYSSAVAEDNPELRAARRKSIPVVHRAEMLAELMRCRKGIAVSGTHGKTTTSSMIATLLIEAGFDPTVLLGARVSGIGSNARLGQGPWLVAEADESDRSFLRLPSICAVVTNIDCDHMDAYRDLADLQQAFVRFMNRVPFYGTVVACTEDPSLTAALKKVHRRVITYSIGGKADICARNLRLSSFSSSYDCFGATKRLGRLTLNVPGRHNVLNSLAAVAVGWWLKIPFPAMQRAMGLFEGAERRMQWKGERDGVAVIDDYAHHPTEIAATLQACRNLERERLIVVFQPHRYTRTQYLMGKMFECFRNADRLYVLEIYAAGEEPLPGVTSRALTEEISRQRQATYVAGKQEMVRILDRETRAGDLVLTLGAGDVWEIGERFLVQES